MRAAGVLPGLPAVASGKDGNFYAADPQCWKEVKNDA